MSIRYRQLGLIDAVETVDDVFLKQLAVNEEVSAQQLRFAPGAVVSEHSHRHERLGYLVSGRAVFITDLFWPPRMNPD